jgi:hypothetical protein
MMGRRFSGSWVKYAYRVVLVLNSKDLSKGICGTFWELSHTSQAIQVAAAPQFA